VDVVACYHDQLKYTPFFSWGMRENLDSINRIFIVCDGLWDAHEREYIETHFPKGKCELLWHKKFAHGVGPSFNQAARESSADYLYLMSFDQILPPGHLEKMLKQASPECLTIGHVDSIDEDTLLSDLPPTVTRKDNITAKARNYRAMVRPWCYARNGCTIVHRETFRTLGGFDESFASIGYGLEDLEFGVRFCRRYGLDSIVLSPARSWHFSSEAPTFEERHKKMPKPEAFALLALALGKLYNRKYVLFAEKMTARDAVLITHTRQKAPGADVRLDCVEPDWIPVGSAYLIETTIVNNEHIGDSYRHLAFLVDRIDKDGVIRIVGGCDPLLLERLVKDYTLEVDFERDCVELSREYV
jgi:hypothetical protein